ncbi:hypothetical protein T11_15972 [Trichinella zimbabwensis]|uniref:Secreted protein n=1 Tax=Trichinella zimbabwensis TaxID=268475 RepID=A0A0V1GZS9_9BILA|nr:hypothetical protein T11_15972 [Trichinella zimbabwensis]
MFYVTLLGLDLALLCSVEQSYFSVVCLMCKKYCQMAFSQIWFAHVEKYEEWRQEKVKSRT